MSAKKNTKANGDASKAKKTKSVQKRKPKATPKPAKDEVQQQQQQRVSPDQQIGFHNHYIKDLSFENPNAPTIYGPSETTPEVSVGFSVASSPVPGRDRHFEVVLSINATAKRGDETMFVLELSYGGEVSVAPEMDERNINPVVMIEGPRFLFPFARAAIATISREGGFMPINLQPIDFIRLYRANLQQKAAQQEGGGAAS